MPGRTTHFGVNLKGLGYKSQAARIARQHLHPYGTGPARREAAKRAKPFDHAAERRSAAPPVSRHDTEVDD